MFTGILVEGQQRLLVFEQTLDGARILLTVDLGELPHKFEILLFRGGVVHPLQVELNLILQSFWEVGENIAHLMTPTALVGIDLIDRTP